MNSIFRYHSSPHIMCILFYALCIWTSHDVHPFFSAYSQRPKTGSHSRCTSTFQRRLAILAGILARMCTIQSFSACQWDGYIYLSTYLSIYLSIYLHTHLSCKAQVTQISNILLPFQQACLLTRGVYQRPVDQMDLLQLMLSHNLPSTTSRTVLNAPMQVQSASNTLFSNLENSFSH